MSSMCGTGMGKVSAGGGGGAFTGGGSFLSSPSSPSSSSSSSSSPPKVKLLWAPTARVVLQKLLEPPRKILSSMRKQHIAKTHLNFRKFVQFLFRVAMRAFPPSRRDGARRRPRLRPKTDKPTLQELHDTTFGLPAAYRRMLEEHIFPFAKELNHNLQEDPAFKSALQAALDRDQNPVRPCLVKIFNAMRMRAREASFRSHDEEWRAVPKWMRGRMQYSMEWHEFQVYVEKMGFLDVFSIRVIAEAFLSSGTVNCMDGEVYVTIEWRQFMEVHLRLAIELHADNAASKLQRQGKQPPARTKALYQALYDEKIQNSKKIFVIFEIMQLAIHHVLININVQRTGADPTNAHNWFWCSKSWTDALHSFFEVMEMCEYENDDGIYDSY